VAGAAGVVLALWLSAAWAQGVSDEAAYELNFSKGLIAFEAGRLAEAEELFTRALIAKPGDADAGYYLGQTLLRLRKFAAAEQVFRQILETEPASHRALLGLAIALYNLEQDRAALEALERAERLDPTDPLVLYYQGLVYQRLKDYERAPGRFLRAMALSPDLAHSAHYFSGVAYYQRGAYEEAKEAFEAAIAAQPASALSQSAQDFLRQMQNLPPPQPKRWTLEVTFSAEWDTNVVLLPNDTQPPAGSTGISQKQDYRTVLYGRGEYRAIQTEQWAAGASYGLYQSWHRTLSGFDVEDHSPTAFLRYHRGPLWLTAEYVYNYTLVGRAPYLIANAAQVLATHEEGARTFTQLEFRYQYKDFQHGRFPLNSARDGINWLGGVSQYLLFAGGEGRFRLGYVFDTDLTGGGSPTVAPLPGELAPADWAYRGNRVITSLELPPVYTAELDMAFEYYRVNYLHPNSLSLDGLTRRQDRIYAFTATLSRDFARYFTAALQYSYTRDQSNIEAFDWNRSIYSFILTGTF
jgi:tetratricopeptide (TPR) repeat protein